MGQALPRLGIKIPLNRQDLFSEVSLQLLDLAT